MEHLKESVARGEDKEAKVINDLSGPLLKLLKKLERREKVVSIHVNTE